MNEHHTVHLRLNYWSQQVILLDLEGGVSVTYSLLVNCFGDFLFSRFGFHKLLKVVCLFYVWTLK